MAETAGVEEQFAYNQNEWKAISLTHVEYPKGDLLGLLLAWTSLLPIFLIISFVTLILSRRDLHTISYFCGVVLNEALNWVLKHMIKQPRPARDRAVVFTEYGMPSSHAQFMYFVSSYLMCFLFIRIHYNIQWAENLWKYVSCVGAFVASAMVIISRVYLGYHSLEQVLCGALVGAVCGVLWFYVVHKFLTPFFPTIASWSISEFLMLRDSTLIPNVLWFEYTSHRAEARSRLRKNNTRKSS